MRNIQGVTVWFTGIPCCGKTTIAKQVAQILRDKDYKVEHLDGDIVRKDLTSDLGFSKEDREKNLKRVTFVAKLLTRNNVIVLATFVSPYKNRREKSREEIGNFIEVFVKCPVELCIKRDVKGMYKLAKEGKIKNFTGVDDPYEEPDNPDLILYSDKETVDESVSKVIEKLKEQKYVDF